MTLAHSFGSTGPDVELLLLAIALVVLAVTLFVQKSAKPYVPVVLLVGAVGFGIGAFQLGGSGSGSGIAVTITSPADGAEVEAGTVRL